MVEYIQMYGFLYSYFINAMYNSEIIWIHIQLHNKQKGQHFKKKCYQILVKLNIKSYLNPGILYAMCNESDRSDRHHIHGKVTLLNDQGYILCISIYTFISPNLIDWDTCISLNQSTGERAAMAINTLRLFKKK